MASVKPFSALRYDFDKAGNPEYLCCPPYDIIPDSKVWLARSPYNIIRLEKPEGDEPYKAAADTLALWKRENILRRDETPAFYLYEEEFLSYGQTYKVSGLLSHVELTPFSDGVVLPHENTLSKAKVDRYELMMAARCHFSPIYSLYEDEKLEISPILAKVTESAPETEFTMPDGIIHRLWRIASPQDCEKIERAFAAKKLFIADGHHRYETSLKVWQELGDKASPYVLMMLTEISNPGLVVYPTHRILSDLDNFDVKETLRKIESSFVIEKDDSLARNAVVFITPDGSYRLTLKDDSFDGLDVNLLHDYILEPFFGIDPANMANQKNLSYTRSEEEAFAKVRNGEAQCAFLLNPTKVSQIRDVALAGGKMPQKSTYFYPKLITGLVINEFSL